MSVARVTEITASSTVSFEDAIAQGVARADSFIAAVRLASEMASARANR